MTVAPIFPDSAVHRRALAVAEGGQAGRHAPANTAITWGATEIARLTDVETKHLNAAMYALGRHPEAFRALLGTLTGQTIDPEDPHDMPTAIASGVLGALGACHAPAVLQLL